MRNLTAAEIIEVAGGLTLGTIVVTAPYGGGGGVFGGGGGGGGGTQGGGVDYMTMPVGQQQLLIGVIKEFQAAAADGEIPTDWVQAGVDASTMAANLLQAGISNGEKSFQMYEDTGFSPNPMPGSIPHPINWGNVDWSKFAQGATTFQQALQDAYEKYWRPT